MPFQQRGTVGLNPVIALATCPRLHPTIEFRNEKIPKLFYKWEIYRVYGGDRQLV